jgi:hypothetical protein
MGEALGEGGGLMRSGPSKAAEAMIAVLVPPACREEVLGDLQERYRSPRQYGLEALRTVPMVILSRIRRTADPQVLLMQAFALYISFLGAAWFKDPGLLRDQWGLMRLAIPAGIALLGMVTEDAYTTPGPRSHLSLVRGPILGLGCALASQGLFWAGNPDLAVPRLILFYGCAMSLLLTSMIRMSFPPATDRLQAVNAPASWLKQAGGAGEETQGIIPVAKGIAAVVAASILVAFIAYHLWKRG